MVSISGAAERPDSDGGGPSPNRRHEGRTTMGKVATGLSMSLDGFVAGPNDGPERPLGDGGERLFA